jgi:hypothetical protein
MIHDELGRSWIIGDDGPEGVETRSPLDYLLAAEGEVPRAEAISIGLEAIRSLHTWVSDQGPHPRRIAERLVKASAHYAPGEVRSLSAADSAAILGEPAARDRALMRILLAQPRARSRATEDHAARINVALAKAYRREGHTWSGDRSGSRLEALIAEDMLAGPEEEIVRREMLRRWLRQMWAGGSLADALKAYYALTRAYWPELLLNMSGEEISTLFAQTRAAESERVHRLVTRPVERHTQRRGTLRWQKSTSACGKYAEAQRGNHHRADAAKRAA